MRKWIPPLISARGLLALMSTSSHATLMIAAEVNGFTFNCADGDACDINATPGILTLAPTNIGGVTFAGSEQVQSVGPSNALFTNSLSIRNNTGVTATIQFAVGGTSFEAPTETFTASGSGTWQNANGSNIEMQWYGDTTNQQGAEDVTDLPGQLLTSAGPFTAVGAADSYSTGMLTGGFPDRGPFSWTMYAEGDLVSGATMALIGRSQDIVSDVTAVPEPGSLALLGAGLLSLGAFLWFRRSGKRTTTTATSLRPNGLPGPHPLDVGPGFRDRREHDKNIFWQAR